MHFAPPILPFYVSVRCNRRCFPPFLRPSGGRKLRGGGKFLKTAAPKHPGQFPGKSAVGCNGAAAMDYLQEKLQKFVAGYPLHTIVQKNGQRIFRLREDAAADEVRGRVARPSFLRVTNLLRVWNLSTVVRLFATFLLIILKNPICTHFHFPWKLPKSFRCAIERTTREQHNCSPAYFF